MHKQLLENRMMKNNNRTVALNMIANVLSFGVSLIISFFLTPYITKNVGTEAYGLVGLANSFINYINVITAALNSMASRFIIIELHKKNTKKANIYYSSVLIANTIFAFVLLLPAIWLIINIKILNISPDFLFDARMTFSIIFINFIVSLLGAFLGIVLYAKNILWKGSFRTLESNILSVFLIVVFFILFGTKIYYVVLATLVSGLYCYAFNYYYTKKYTPELRVRKKYFSFSAIKELAAAGIWNSITKLSQILLDGLDLLLSNLFINGLMTGNVSIAKTIPSLYTSLVAMLSDSFYPEFLENYSKNRKEELLKNIKQSINILSMISGICLSMLLVYAKDFYMLWLPDNDANLLRNLTILGTGTVLISGCVYSLFSVFSLTNKVKANSMVLLITGILSTVTTFLCLKFTNLGVYAIVGVSSIYGIVRNLTFTPIYAAKCLNFKFWTFYPVIFKNLLNVALLIVVENIMKRLIVPNTWLLLIVNGILDVIVGTLITLFIMFNAQDRKTAIKKILRK